MNSIKYFFGTGFYSGLIPKAPGTAGSFVALAIILGIVQAQQYSILLVFILAASVITLWVASFFEDKYEKDPGRLVSDEWAGQALTFITISFSDDLTINILTLLTGFILFRFFDIIKPLGIKRLQNLPGGWGILTDDLLAGLYALICLKTLIFVLPNIFGMV